MRQTVAYKKLSVGILYIALAIAGAGMIVYAISEKYVPIGVIGAILMIGCGVLSVRFLLLPLDIIQFSEEGTVILPGGTVVPLKDICDVSYKRASAGGIQYRWGSVTLSTKYGTYKYGFVADCEEVSKQLTRLVFDAKNIAERSVI